MRELFAEYSSHMNSSAQNDQTIENVEFQVDHDNIDDNPWADWGQHVALELRTKTSDLDMYLEEECLCYY